MVEQDIIITDSEDDLSLASISQVSEPSGVYIGNEREIVKQLRRKQKVEVVAQER